VAINNIRGLHDVNGVRSLRHRRLLEIDAPGFGAPQFFDGSGWLGTRPRQRSLSRWLSPLKFRPVQLTNLGPTLHRQHFPTAPPSSTRVGPLDQVPKFLHGLARAQTGVKSEMFYRAVHSGELSYRMHCLVKD
jgi:hypothetical protein